MQHRLHLAGQFLENLQVRADYPEFDRRIDGRTVLEKHQFDARAADTIKLFAQTLDHAHAFFAAPFVHHGKHLTDGCGLCGFKAIIENRRIFAADIFGAHFNRWLLGQDFRNLANDPARFIQTGTLLRLHSDAKVR